MLQGSLRLPLGHLPPPLAPSGDDDGDGAASPSASGEEVEEQLRPLGRAYDELRRSAGATLVEMLRLQRALLLRSEVRCVGEDVWGCVGMRIWGWERIVSLMRSSGHGSMGKT